jgi:hypothetical protein
MPLMPFAMLWMWFRGLLALALLGGGIWLLYAWYDALPRPTPPVQTDTDVTRASAPAPSFSNRVARRHPGLTWETAALGGGLFLVLVALGGGRLVYPLRWRAGGPEFVPPQAGTVQRLTRPDCTALHIESFGPPDALPIVLTHGWGVTSAQWDALRQHLGTRFRLVVWDLPGLGCLATPPHGGLQPREDGAGPGGHPHVARSAPGRPGGA